MINALLKWASARGYQVAWGPVSIVEEAKAVIAGLTVSGELDRSFYQSDLEGELAPQEYGSGRSVVMVAKRRPAHSVTFDLEAAGGGKLKAILPPTYVHYRRTFEEVRQDLVRNGLPGARVEHLHGPHKAIAARLGLVKYGKNNITYAPGIGSYLQLCGYLTDAPLPSPPAGQEPELLPECEGCEKCRKACPTQAIGADRVLLRAHRCLTFANEAPGDWPDWVPDRRHQCLVGCLFCQRVCPANPVLPVEETGLDFSATETLALIENPENLPQTVVNSIAKKISWLGLTYKENTLGRNLAGLLKSPRPAGLTRCRAPLDQNYS